MSSFVVASSTHKRTSCHQWWPEVAAYRTREESSLVRSSACSRWRFHTPHHPRGDHLGRVCLHFPNWGWGYHSHKSSHFQHRKEHISGYHSWHMDRRIRWHYWFLYQQQMTRYVAMIPEGRMSRRCHLGKSCQWNVVGLNYL